MSKLFLCAKHKGNTFDVCHYVSKHTDIDLEFFIELEDLDLNQYDTIILSTGIYGGNEHINLKKWIENLNKDQLSEHTKIYVLLTWFGRGRSDRTVYNKINNYLQRINMKLEENYLTLFGKGMGIIRIKHPNQNDFEKALEWVK